MRCQAVLVLMGEELASQAVKDGLYEKFATRWSADWARAVLKCSSGDTNLRESLSAFDDLRRRLDLYTFLASLGE